MNVTKIRALLNLCNRLTRGARILPDGGWFPPERDNFTYSRTRDLLTLTKEIREELEYLELMGKQETEYQQLMGQEKPMLIRHGQIHDTPEHVLDLPHVDCRTPEAEAIKGYFNCRTKLMDERRVIDENPIARRYEEKRQKVVDEIAQIDARLDKLLFTTHLWIASSQKLPEEGTEVFGFHPEWLDDDFNPKGIRLCTFFADHWRCAVWNNTHDGYDTRNEAPSLWTTLPLNPVELNTPRTEKA